MNRFVHGLAWGTAYLALLLAPAVTAAIADPIAGSRPLLVEFGVGLGLVAFALVLTQFALVSRLRAASRPFGTDALVQFHQYMGLVCLGLVLAHPIALNLAGLPWSAWNPASSSLATASGAVASWALVALVVTTLWRRVLGWEYETWQWVHLALSIVASGGMTVHVMAINGYTASPVVRALLAGYAGAFGALVIGYRVIRPLRMRTRPWIVAANRNEGASTRTLCLRPDRHDGFVFDPGQFAWLSAGESAWSQQHPFSISSSAELGPDRELEFSIKALGDWTSHVVPTLKQGNRLWVDGPFGAFTTEGAAGQGFVLLAGGIGIAPMRSMLLTMRDRGDRRHVVLFYAAHDPSRLVYREELEGLRASLALDLVYVFEEPGDAGTGERGTITRELLARRLPPHARRYHYFVCGPPPMMDAVEAALAALGIPRGSIESERFNLA